MTDNIPHHRLIGAIDPIGKSLGFLIPVYLCYESNSLRVQKVDAANRISAFEELDLQEVPVQSTRSKLAAVGDQANWMFAFGPDDVLIGSGDQGKVELASRLDSAFFDNKPMLAFEVAEFLQMRGKRLFFAREVLNFLKRAGSEAGDRWRDLTLLTPDVRQRLRKSGLREIVPAHYANRIVLTVSRNQVSVRGLDSDVEGEIWHRITSETESVLRDLRSLYQNADGWRFVLAQGLGFKERRSTDLSSIDALVYAADSECAEAVWMLRSARNLSIETYSPSEIRRFSYRRSEFNKPSFIVYQGDAANDFSSVVHTDFGPSIGLEWSPSKQGDYELFESRGSQFQAVVIVIRPPSTMKSRSDSDNMSRLLIRVIGTVCSAKREMVFSSLPFQRNIFIGSQGDGPRPLDDAWARIYDRAWSQGISHFNGFRFVTSRQDREHFRSEGNWVGKILFPETKEIFIKENNSRISATKADASIIVGVEPKGVFDDAMHQESLQKIIRRQKWKIVDRHAIERSIYVSGNIAKFEILLEPEIVSRRSVRNLSTLLHIDLSKIDRIAATWDASPGSILRRLRERGEMAANMRDLCLFHSTYGNIWTLVASQLRRLSSGILSRSRTNYFGLLIHHAFLNANVQMDRSGDLYDAIRDDNLGEDLHLICSGVHYEEGVANSRFRFVAGYGNRYVAPQDNIISRFELTIDADGPRLSQNEDDSE